MADVTVNKTGKTTVISTSTTASPTEVDVFGRQGPVGPEGPQGPQGPPGPAGEDANFVFTQSTPASQWDITHDLGKTPAVMVVDSAGTVVQGRILVLSSSEIRLEFSAPFSGTAYLN